MKIVILGSGAMGSLYGGYLSEENDVYLVCRNDDTQDIINASGIRIIELDGSEKVFRPHAVADPSSIGKADLVILFVKSMDNRRSLAKAERLIGENTYLMTLQNGAGHDGVMADYCRRDHIIIGTSQHNSSLISPGVISHGGSGMTSIGLLEGDSSLLEGIASAFRHSGLECVVSSDITYEVWHKLFTNTAASTLTAVYGVPLGSIVSVRKINEKMRSLASEAVTVADAMGLSFDKDTVIEEIERTALNAKDGYTSIYWDIKKGRKTEVDSISGEVLRKASELGIPVPVHEWVVKTIHEMERNGGR